MIVIPMVGKSSRFFDAGYTRPKYELVVWGYSVFHHAVNSFCQYFERDSFLFIIRNDYGAKDFVQHELELLGLKRFYIKVLDDDTRGQADTVFQGIQDVDKNEPLYIFNIDTFRPGFIKPAISEKCDGYLEVFEGEGNHWSFVEAGQDGQVIRTTEKQRISNLCSDGLYFFGKKSYFEEAYKYAVLHEKTDRGEFYVAPLYNILIKQGLDIRFVKIDRSELVFCGTPLEFEALINQAPSGG